MKEAGLGFLGARGHYVAKIATVYVLFIFNGVATAIVLNWAAHADAPYELYKIFFAGPVLLFIVFPIDIVLFIWLIRLMVQRLRDSGRRRIWVIPYIGLVLSLGLYYLLSFLHRIQEEVNLAMVVFLVVAAPIVLAFLPVQRPK